MNLLSSWGPPAAVMSTVIVIYYWKFPNWLWLMWSFIKFLGCLLNLCYAISSILAKFKVLTSGKFPINGVILTTCLSALYRFWQARHILSVFNSLDGLIVCLQWRKNLEKIYIDYKSNVKCKTSGFWCVNLDMVVGNKNIKWNFAWNLGLFEDRLFDIEYYPKAPSWSI